MLTGTFAVPSSGHGTFVPSCGRLKEEDSSGYSRDQCSGMAFQCILHMQKLRHTYTVCGECRVCSVLPKSQCSYHVACSHGQSLEEPRKGVSLNGRVSFGRVGIACFKSYNPTRLQELRDLLVLYLEFKNIIFQQQQSIHLSFIKFST